MSHLISSLSVSLSLFLSVSERVSGSIAISVVVACSIAHTQMKTWARHEVETGHLGRRAIKATKDKMDPFGTTEEERRTTKKTNLVGVCFWQGEAHGRLGGRWRRATTGQTKSQQHRLRHDVYFLKTDAELYTCHRRRGVATH